eukprot:GHVR01099475.1.p2 GENE.GHVR01099475.1~~GHVR01099475.1.p2  ORF type:complete len:113 (+),score=28.72 GHVR01099475.1:799-1137(+)
MDICGCIGNEVSSFSGTPEMKARDILANDLFFPDLLNNVMPILFSDVTATELLGMIKGELPPHMNVALENMKKFEASMFVQITEERRLLALEKKRKKKERLMRLKKERLNVH